MNDDGDHVLFENVADVAQVAPGRLMKATLDGEKEMLGGTIFGAFGRWKMWFELGGETQQFLASDPMTTPDDDVAFHYRSGEQWLKNRLRGRIMRLKRADL